MSIVLNVGVKLGVSWPTVGVNLGVKIMFNSQFRCFL